MRRRRVGVSHGLIEGTLVAGDVIVADGHVEEVGVSPPGRRGIAVPGFIDVQVNGFAGIDFTTADEPGFATALTALARTGVTACLPTIPTAARDRYLPALAVAEQAKRTTPQGASRSLGVHLEGPFLSPEKPGAHRADLLAPVDVGWARELVATGAIAMMTLAPELPRALELIELLRASGIVVSLGHTAGDRASAHAAFDAGASALTHLWNAQLAPTAREPHVAGTALARDDVHVGVICDLIHVDADTLRFSIAALGERFVVVSDAVSVTGLADGPHGTQFGPVTTSSGAVRLADGTLAGSATPMDEALRNLLGLGLPVEAAVNAMTVAPARLLGHGDVGTLRPGAPADVVVLDGEMQVILTLVAGVATA